MSTDRRYNCMLPPDFGEPRQCARFDEVDGHHSPGPANEPQGPVFDPLPEHTESLFATAGITGIPKLGQTLNWGNGTLTAAQFDRARVKVDVQGAWVEFQVYWLSGRIQTLRFDRYLDVLQIGDTMPLANSESLSVASARLLLDFRAATAELMITH